MQARKLFLTTAALALSGVSGLLASPAAQAQADQPALRILVGFPPGGSADTIARLLSERLPAALGSQAVVVDNKPGAAGHIGYQRMIAQMDEGIGRVMAALQQAGVGRDALVVFTSDNGGERFSDNGPLVGGKLDLTEGGIRVPWIAHWPAVIAPCGVSEQHCLTMGWRATLLAAGGWRLAAGGVSADPAYPLDGVSLLPVLQDPAAVFERPMAWRMLHRSQRAYRQDDWKYLQVDGHEYLFNIPADERERANLAKREPGRLAALRQAWAAWNALMPPIPDDATVSLRYGVADMPQR